jgi:hypothetical protein
VTRAELLDRFWEGRDGYDDTLRKYIGTIRKALDDRAEQLRFNETRRTEGCRHIRQMIRWLHLLEPWGGDAVKIGSVGSKDGFRQSRFLRRRLAAVYKLNARTRKTAICARVTGELGQNSRGGPAAQPCVIPRATKSSMNS